MKCLANWNPLSFNGYVNLGNDCQKFCSSKQPPHLALRIGVGVCAKIAGRLQDIALNVLFGSFKLTVSTAMAIYSVPAAAFGCLPNHHKLAKQGSRHIALAVSYIFDIPLSFANIVNKYPQDLAEEIQKKLQVNACTLAVDEITDNFDSLSEDIQKTRIGEKTDHFQRIYQKNQRLKEQNNTLKVELKKQSEIIHGLTQEIQVLEEYQKSANELLAAYKKLPPNP